jgi:hypothetical protein
MYCDRGLERPLTSFPVVKVRGKTSTQDWPLRKTGRHNSRLVKIRGLRGQQALQPLRDDFGVLQT